MTMEKAYSLWKQDSKLKMFVAFEHSENCIVMIFTGVGKIDVQLNNFHLQFRLQTIVEKTVEIQINRYRTG